MLNSISSTVSLHNGIEMPWLGLGVYKAEDGKQVIDAVKSAIRAGYRSIDTAAIYKNEEGVGQAIKQTEVPREQLFITSKVWNSDQGFESTLRAFEDSLARLNLDYLDLYLIHWPVEGKYKETWRALEQLYKDGKVRSIGVSNFHVHHLQDLLTEAEIKPMVNQVEFHPKLLQEELRNFCREHQIQFEAWSPLMHGKLLDNELLTEIANKHNKTAAQVILRWDLQSGVVTIPKSIKEHRIIENASIFDFEITNEDMRTINDLNEDLRFGPDPDNFDF
ncbi:aldo/keto reductase [Cytobacillus sp. IB215665]|uniref:aldo/keto reductase n=1 Tax=Cytobacillus sp. IB215665 TaxID=3097357 RepID=UPI002A13EABC|nr:aldo/keto reductase [Cytobacillus sp. IB215665]MDX8365984.1 aldo/keto reductase [Cytobacillus sp. IB215665]